jgi:type VI secretion system secreted protein Hcp
MASDYLLEISGIEGESQDSKHKQTIEIASFSLGVSHPGDFRTNTGGATGKASFQDVHFATKVSKASPNLFQACAMGKHVDKATLYVRKATGDGGQQEYLKIELKDIMVSSYQVGGHEGGDDSIPGDQFSLNYAKIEFIYKPQTAQGTLGPDVTMKYDIAAQKR